MIYVAIGVFFVFLFFQIKLYKETRKKIDLLSQLFPKDGIKYVKDDLTIC